MYFWRVLSLVTISRWLLCGWWRDFPVDSGETIYWKIRFPRNFKYSPTLLTSLPPIWTISLNILFFLTLPLKIVCIRKFSLAHPSLVCSDLIITTYICLDNRVGEVHWKVCEPSWYSSFYIPVNNFVILWFNTYISAGSVHCVHRKIEILVTKYRVIKKRVRFIKCQYLRQFCSILNKIIVMSILFTLI